MKVDEDDDTEKKKRTPLFYESLFRMQARWSVRLSYLSTITFLINSQLFKKSRQLKTRQSYADMDERETQIGRRLLVVVEQL